MSLFCLNECADCRRKLDLHRLKQERRHVEIMRTRDAKRLLLPRKEQFQGVRVEWLIAFTCDHDCWLWPTWRVVRDIIVPNTMTTRVAYVELDFMQSDAKTVPTIFVSHCWENNFGDVVAACCVGAPPDRVGAPFLRRHACSCAPWRIHASRRAFRTTGAARGWIVSAGSRPSVLALTVGLSLLDACQALRRRSWSDVRGLRAFSP